MQGKGYVAMGGLPGLAQLFNRNPKRWVWTAAGAEAMNEQEGKYVWDNYQSDIPPHWIKLGYIREATEADGEPGQMDLMDFIPKG